MAETANRQTLKATVTPLESAHQLSCECVVCVSNYILHVFIEDLMLPGMLPLLHLPRRNHYTPTVELEKIKSHKHNSNID